MDLDKLTKDAEGRAITEINLLTLKFAEEVHQKVVVDLGLQPGCAARTLIHAIGSMLMQGTQPDERFKVFNHMGLHLAYYLRDYFQAQGRVGPLGADSFINGLKEMGATVTPEDEQAIRAFAERGYEV